MSRSTVVICDRCRSPILEGVSIIRVEASDLRRDSEALDLCRECSARFRDWLRAPGLEPVRHLEPIPAGAPRGEWGSDAPGPMTYETAPGVPPSPGKVSAR